MKRSLQRGLLLSVILGLALAIPAPLTGQGPAPAPGRAGGPAPAGGRGNAQGGSGVLKVLIVTGGHDFDRQGLMEFLDGLGRDITWTHVQQPGAQAFYDPKNAAMFDVLAFYDAPGRVPAAAARGAGAFEDTAPDAKLAFAQMLMAGKGLVFLHHAIAAWTHTWPEYQEVVGGACDWNNEFVYRGVRYPRSGAVARTKQHVTVVDKTHPVVAGLGDGFDITDEAYACPYADEVSVHPLLRTDFVPPDPAHNLGPKKKYSNLSAWYKSAENSPVVWIQYGHDAAAWTNPAYQMLVLNALKWAASPEAKAWAKAQPTKIFKNIKPPTATAK